MEGPTSGRLQFSKLLATDGAGLEKCDASEWLAWALSAVWLQADH